MWKRKKKSEKLFEIPTDRIFPNPYGARAQFSSEGIRALATSIAVTECSLPSRCKSAGRIMN